MKNQFWEFSFEAIGTSWNIEGLHPALSSTQSKQLEKQVLQRIEEFDKTYSRFRSDSLVSSLNSSAQVCVFPDDADVLWELYRTFYDVSHGQFTPLVGSFLEDLGYDAQYSLVAQSKREKIPEWEQVMSYDSQRRELTTHQPVCLDFGAGGKGYLVDLVVSLLRQAGFVELSVDAGGDIFFFSKQGNEITIGLEDPRDFNRVIGVATLSGGSLCASSGSRRQWQEHHHIIDPQRRKSAQGVLATWVVAERTILADMLATCLFFVEPKKLQEHFSFEYVVLYDGSTVKKSAGFIGEIFTKRQSTSI